MSIGCSVEPAEQQRVQGYSQPRLCPAARGNWAQAVVWNGLCSVNNLEGLKQHLGASSNNLINGFNGLEKESNQKCYYL